jgi:hypothetical protein
MLSTSGEIALSCARLEGWGRPRLGMWPCFETHRSASAALLSMRAAKERHMFAASQSPM